MSRRAANRRVKRWPGWVLLALAIVGLLAVGATGDAGPRTPDERVDTIAKRLACPVCDGESVYESRNPASNQIREAIKQAVADGQQTDDQIIQRIVNAYSGEELLVPTASGIESLAWALPAAAFVLAVIGLTIAFRRWRASAAALGQASDADYELVAGAIADDEAAGGQSQHSPATPPAATAEYGRSLRRRSGHSPGAPTEQ